MVKNYSSPYPKTNKPSTYFSLDGFLSSLHKNVFLLDYYHHPNIKLVKISRDRGFLFKLIGKEYKMEKCVFLI